MWFPKFEKKEIFLLTVQDRGRLAESIFLKLRMVTIEHLLPVSKGGGNEPENLALLCSFCNSAKAGHLPYGIASWADHE